MNIRRKLNVLIVCSLLLISQGVFAAEEKINHAENAYDAGMVAYENKDYQNAVYAFQNSIDYNSKLYKSHYMLGLSLFMNNDVSNAVHVLKKVSADFPKEWKAQVLLGEYYAGQKQYDLGISYYKQALESRKLKKDEREIYQTKLEKLRKEQADKWRLSETEKINVLNDIKFNLDRNWRAAIIEKQEDNIHIVYASRDDDYQDDKWKTVVDLMCYPATKGMSFNQFNEITAEKYREVDAEMDTLELDLDARIFETRTDGNPRLYIIGRIFSTPRGYCLAQVKSKSKIKEKDLNKWIDIVKGVQVNG